MPCTTLGNSLYLPAVLVVFRDCRDFRQGAPGDSSTLTGLRLVPIFSICRLTTPDAAHQDQFFGSQELYTFGSLYSEAYSGTRAVI